MRRSKVGSTLWEKKEQGKPLSFYLSPEITLATPTTVTHRPSFFLSFFLSYVIVTIYIGTRKRFLFIGTHFQRQRFLTFFSLLEKHRRILSAVLFAVFSYLFYFFFMYISYCLFGAFWLPNRLVDHPSALPCTIEFNQFPPPYSPL